jgi:thioredoxin
MKKITILLGFVLMISLTACSSNTGGDDSKASQPVAGTEGTDLTDQGKVMHINAAQFKELVWDYSKNTDNWVFNGDLPLIIDFYADWCRPCKIIAPIMDELAEEYKGKIRIYKINTDKEKELASVFNIRSIPAVLFVPADDKPQMSVGALPKSTFEQAIKEVLKVQE